MKKTAFSLFATRWSWLPRCRSSPARPRRQRGTDGAQANLDKYRAGADVHGARARRSTRRRRPAARRSSSSRRRASVPFVSTIANNMKRIGDAGGRQDDDLAEPGPAVAVGAGHERGDRAEGERDRPARGQRPRRRCSRRSRRPRRRASRRSSPTSTTTTRSRRRTSAASSTSPTSSPGS